MFLAAFAQCGGYGAWGVGRTEALGPLGLGNGYRFCFA